MATSLDLDQLASSEANWSWSTLFAKTGHRVKKQMCMLQTKYEEAL